MGYLRCDQAVAWAALQATLQAHGRDLDLRALFAADPTRVERLTIEAPKCSVTCLAASGDVATARHLFDLARECSLPAQRDAMLRAMSLTPAKGVRHCTPPCVRLAGMRHSAI